MSSLKQRKPSEVPQTPTEASSPTALKKGKEPALLVNSKDKWRSWWVRAWTSFVMLGGFIVIFSFGHIPLCALVLAVQVQMFKEIVKLGSVTSRERSIPGFHVLPWIWFTTAMFFTYGRLMSRYFGTVIPYHNFISFMLYSLGLVSFVFSLKKGHYKYQFGQFAWVHLTLLLVVVQSSFLVVNMFQGLVWFTLPCLLIISNDSWAYFFGFFFGRTPLIKISPKKTWEGFIGATVMTLVTGVLLGHFMSQFEFMVCPKLTFDFNRPSCTPSATFLPTDYSLPTWLLPILARLGVERTSITLIPMQIHGLVLAVFSSIVAPFGGFFASGFKRAFKIKDFGESIPGHGGVTDRMDCQIMNGLFVFVYYWSFVVVRAKDPASVLTAFSLMTPEDQLVVFGKIQEFLTAKGLLPAAL